MAPWSVVKCIGNHELIMGFENPEGLHFVRILSEKVTQIGVEVGDHAKSS